MKKIAISFPFEGKSITLESVIEEGKKTKDVARELLEEATSLANPGMVTSAQLKALWGKALARGWNRDQVREFLENQIGESRDEQIVGKVPSREFSRVIDSISGEAGEQAPPEEKPGMVTSTQLKVLWGKALAKGWSRDQVSEFLANRIGENRDERIVGNISMDRLEELIKELAA